MGICTRREFGKAEDIGVVEFTTSNEAPFTADQAASAADVPWKCVEDVEKVVNQGLPTRCYLLEGTILNN